MNKLPPDKRVQILSMLCEGSSMRSASRIADVSVNTVAKLSVDAGEAYAIHHFNTVIGVNAFSKKLHSHIHALSLYFVFYNFVRIHKSLKVTLAMAADATDRLWSMEDIAALVEANEAPAKSVHHIIKGPPYGS